MEKKTETDYWRLRERNSVFRCEVIVTLKISFTAAGHHKTQFQVIVILTQMLTRTSTAF